MWRWLGIFFAMLRIGFAGLLAWLCWQHAPAVEARDHLNALPRCEFVAEAKKLEAAGRIPEAMLHVAAGERWVRGAQGQKKLLEIRQRLARVPGADALLVPHQDPALLFAKWVAGPEASARFVERGRAGVDLLSQSALRGPPGLRFAEENAVLLLAPHPILVVLKQVLHGAVPLEVEHTILRHETALMWIATAWLAIEVVWFGFGSRRLFRGKDTERKGAEG